VSPWSRRAERRPFPPVAPDDPSNGPRTLHADLRGLPNPEPVLALAEWAARLGPGETLDVITDDPCAHSDFMRWLAGTDIKWVDARCLPDMAMGYVFRRAGVPR
jgi:TusA-related sulfurtransferase